MKVISGELFLQNTALAYHHECVSLLQPDCCVSVRYTDEECAQWSTCHGHREVIISLTIDTNGEAHSLDERVITIAVGHRGISAVQDGSDQSVILISRTTPVSLYKLLGLL